jgi:nicotinate phosphoribosyltransferase
MSANFLLPHPSDQVLSRLDGELVATLEFLAECDGVFAGVDDAVAFLKLLALHPLQVWAIEQGANLKHGDVAMRVHGHFVEYGKHANALAGILAVQSGWATGTRALSNAAKPQPLIFLGASAVHPSAASQLQKVAVENGCLSPDSLLGQGIVPRALILLARDTVHAARLYESELSPDVPLLVPADIFHEPADEAARVALALGDKLSAIVLHDEGAQNPIDANLLLRVRTQLELAGFPRVKIFVSGDVTPEKIVAWQDAQARLDGYVVSDSIALAPPLPFAIELRECDGKPLARRGQTPGTTPSLRMERIDIA